MFANRFTAFVDACSLTGALKRNLLLTLAEAEFFRLRWSARVLDETQIAIEKILEKKGLADAAGRAARARQAMERAFEDATVEAYEKFLPVGSGLPDAGDAHVLAAALKTGAHIIVTDNLKDFPKSVLKPLNLEALSTDQFVANTIALDTGRAVDAINRMRLRFHKPGLDAPSLLIEMEAVGLLETVDTLRPHTRSL